MENEELFNKKLKSAKKIRKIIQEDFRADYNRQKKLFNNVTGLDGNKVLKHLVDMRHYRNGMYPSPASPPKHTELMDKFVIFFKFFHLLGWDKEFVHDYLAEYGVEVKITKDWEVENIKFDEDQKAILESQETFDADTIKDLKGFLTVLIGHCDELQGKICSFSNKIKRDIAETVKEECGIKKGDFTSTVMFEYKKEKEIEKAEVKGKDDNLKKLKIKLKKDAGSYLDMNRIKNENLEISVFES